MNADDTFVEKYSSFVKDIALSIKTSLGLDTESGDLIGWGFSGLLEAHQRFDQNKGISFRTFAYYRIRGAILDGVRKMCYLPRRAYARLRAAEVLDAESEHSLLTRATNPQMRSDLSAHVRSIDSILGRVAAAYSLAAAAAEYDPQTDTPESDLLLGEAKKAAVSAVDTLPERERILVRGVYFEERPLEDLAKELGVSKSWASRLHSRALDTLREIISDVGG
jgi:RNA polymerase sigma factor FliA